MARSTCISTKEAINVAEFLNDLILRHGCPDYLIRGQNFVIRHGTFDRNVTLALKHTANSDYCENGISEFQNLKITMH